MAGAVLLHQPRDNGVRLQGHRSGPRDRSIGFDDSDIMSTMHKPLVKMFQYRRRRLAVAARCYGVCGEPALLWARHAHCTWRSCMTACREPSYVGVEDMDIGRQQEANRLALAPVGAGY